MEGRLFDDYIHDMKIIHKFAMLNRKAMMHILLTWMTLDESPMAYKSVDDIVAQIGPTADILDHIKPVYNFKAAE